MRDHCQRACDLCPLVPSSILTTNPIVDTRCKDKDKRCSAWAAYANQCHTNRLFMSKVCKETCGYPCISEDHQLDTPESSRGLRKAISGKWLLMLMLSTIFSSSSTLLVMKWSETKSCNRILLSLQAGEVFSAPAPMPLLALIRGWAGFHPSKKDGPASLPRDFCSGFHFPTATHCLLLRAIRVNGI